MTGLFRQALALLLACATPAFADVLTTSVTLSPSAWTDLGAGPMQLTASGGRLAYVVAGAGTTVPLATGGTVLASDNAPAIIQTTQHVYALALVPSYGTGTALVTPITAWNGGTVTGNIGGYEFQLSPTVTVQNAAYSAGNSLGGTITVTGAARTNGGSGMLNGLRIRSAGGSANAVWVYAVSKAPSWTCADKSAFVANAADAANALVGFPQSITLASPGSWDTGSMASLTNLVANFVNKDSSPGTAIYLCLVTAGSVTPATTGDLTLVVSGLQD